MQDEKEKENFKMWLTRYLPVNSVPKLQDQKADFIFSSPLFLG